MQTKWLRRRWDHECNCEVAETNVTARGCWMMEGERKRERENTHWTLGVVCLCCLSSHIMSVFSCFLSTLKCLCDCWHLNACCRLHLHKADCADRACPLTSCVSSSESCIHTHEFTLTCISASVACAPLSRAKFCMFGFFFPPQSVLLEQTHASVTLGPQSAALYGGVRLTICTLYNVCSQRVRA